MKRIKFDLEKWKSGNYDVITGDGDSARIICTDCEMINFPIVALFKNPLHKECVNSYTINGEYYYDAGTKFHQHDLFLVKKKWIPKENETYYFITTSGTINSAIYFTKCILDNNRVSFGNCFKTGQEALKASQKIKEFINSLD